jgi:hypothetical protein
VQCSEFGSGVTSLWPVMHQILPRFQPGALIGWHGHCTVTARFERSEVWIEGILRCLRLCKSATFNSNLVSKLAAEVCAHPMFRRPDDAEAIETRTFER